MGYGDHHGSYGPLGGVGRTGGPGGSTSTGAEAGPMSAAGSAVSPAQTRVRSCAGLRVPSVVPVTLCGCRLLRRPVVTAGRRDGQMRPRWRAFPGLGSVATAVVPATVSATNRLGRPGRRGRWVGGSRGGG